MLPTRLCFKRVWCSVVLVMCWPGLAAGYRPDIGNIATAVTPRTRPREHACQHHAHLHTVSGEVAATISCDRVLWYISSDMVVTCPLWQWPPAQGGSWPSQEPITNRVYWLHLKEMEVISIYRGSSWTHPTVRRRPRPSSSKSCPAPCQATLPHIWGKLTLETHKVFSTTILWERGTVNVDYWDLQPSFKCLCS